MDILRRKLEIVAGVRYDHIYNMDGGVAPPYQRLLRPDSRETERPRRYGITYKAPSLGYLYPDNAYFDILNFDNTTASGFSDAQKFQIATTHVYSAENPDLELAKPPNGRSASISRSGRCAVQSPITRTRPATAT